MQANGVRGISKGEGEGRANGKGRASKSSAIGVGREKCVHMHINKILAQCLSMRVWERAEESVVVCVCVCGSVLNIC